jgi:transcriptional regulator with XRE-family HTH domain
MEKSIHTRDYALFLQILRKFRDELGLTQIDLAARLGVTQTFVSKCERGERRLDVVELKTWCEAMGISLVEFATRLDAESRKKYSD